MVLRYNNRRWDVRNGHHIFRMVVSAPAASAFIGQWGRFAAVAALAAAVLLPGCDKSESASPQRGGPAELTQEPLFADTPSDPTEPRLVPWSPDGSRAAAANPPSAPSVASPGGSGWSIVLITITDPDHRVQAARWGQAFSQITGLTAWIESDDRGSIVRYGRYESIASDAAQTDLARLKNMEISGQAPFRGSYLARFGDDASSGRRSEHHLLAARRMYPGVETLYSLQIGVYEAERDTTAEQARRLAEQAVSQLRALNELAFYYHGVNRSMVCIGVFSEGAVDPATGLYSAAVADLQQRYPYNSYNGRTIEEHIRGRDGKIHNVRQRSFLVVVPEE